MKFATTSTVMLCLASAMACTNQAEPPKIAANGVVQYHDVTNQANGAV